MTDTVDIKTRSRIMSRVRSKNTQPEMAVRRLVFSAGFRYRLHGKALPGKPDLVFAGRRKVIFVHGCFWHRHSGCSLARLPKSRQEFWEPKLEANRERDELNLLALSRSGWGVLVVWECELKDQNALRSKIIQFLAESISN